jgi:hypothetical protein
MTMQSKFAETAQHFSRVAAALLESGARKATMYLSPKLTVKASIPIYAPRDKKGVRKYPKKVHDMRSTRVEILFTSGAPNFEERHFIRLAVKAGEPFPIKKVQLKFLPAQA